MLSNARPEWVKGAIREWTPSKKGHDNLRNPLKLLARLARFERAAYGFEVLEKCILLRDIEIFKERYREFFFKKSNHYLYSESYMAIFRDTAIRHFFGHFTRLMDTYMDT